MNLKYLIVFVLTIIGIVCGISLIIFLASAALHGSFFLLVICLFSVAFVYVFTSSLYKKEQT